MTISTPLRDTPPTFAELFTPKLVTVLREGYGLAALRADAVAGLTVAIVALPLSMAIAIAAGLPPDRGLVTAIVGGFLVSALGGSRFQIGGPAAAFIVLVAASVLRHGVEGMLLATLIAGILLVAMGLLRFGTYIKYIPYPVTVGFTAGIAVIILASQLHDLFGLTLPGAEPGEIIPKLRALAAAAGTFSIPAAAVSVLTIAIIVGIRRWRPAAPGLLIAVVVASVAVWAVGLDVETIGSRFGGIASALPAPRLPDISLDRVTAVLPDAIAFAVLGAIESLLSAVVADSMTGRRHRSNCELVAQGVANVGAALFGGMPVTGTIARTATNVRAGARGPVAGMLHSVFLLALMLVAAPLAAFIPLAALAGVLVIVAWSMVERHAIAAIARSSRGETVVLAVTLLLTVFRDLVEGILVGFAVSAVLFIHRMALAAGVEAVTLEDDRADRQEDRQRLPYDPDAAMQRDVVVCRITGAFFFGAAAAVGAALERTADRYRTLVIDFSAVPLVDATAANAIAALIRRAERRGIRVLVCGVAPALRRLLDAQGLATTPHFPDVASALTAAGAKS